MWRSVETLVLCEAQVAWLVIVGWLIALVGNLAVGRAEVEILMILAGLQAGLGRLAVRTRVDRVHGKVAVWSSDGGWQKVAAHSTDRCLCCAHGTDDMM